MKGIVGDHYANNTNYEDCGVCLILFSLKSLLKEKEFKIYKHISHVENKVASVEALKKFLVYCGKIYTANVQPQDTVVRGVQLQH